MRLNAKSICLTAFLLLLLFLFTVPGAYLDRVCREWNGLTLSAAAAVREEGDASLFLRELERSYEKNSPTLKLFLQHEAVDAVGECIGVCAPLSEQAALLSALNAVNVTAAHLRGLESFRLADLF